MISSLLEKTKNSFFKRICLGVLILPILTLPFIWFYYFDISYPLDVGSVVFSSLYFLITVLSFFIILRLRICILNFGWLLLVFSFLLGLLCELSQPGELISVYIRGELTFLALLIIFVGFYLAIQRYKEAEKKIKESERKYKMIFDFSPEAIVLLDKQAKLITANRRFEEWLGYKVEDFRGKDITEFSFLPPASKKKAVNNFSKRLEGKDPGPYELNFVTKNGKKKVGRLSVALVRDKNNEMVEDLVMVSDVTEQKKAERQVEDLKELDKAKDEFLNVAAHELKTPLASIIGMSQMLQTRRSGLKKEVRSYVDVINKESFRLNRVVKQILTITRFEQGKQEIKEGVFNLGNFINSLRPTFEILAQRTGSKINIEIKDNINIKSDKDKVSEVVYNLVDNAIKYGAEEQVVTIKISKVGKDKAKVEVIDQGEGISKGMQKKIFVKFGQLENYLNRNKEGLGLGLYICKVTTKSLGGQIKLISNPGKGCNFYFILPIERK